MDNKKLISLRLSESEIELARGLARAEGITVSAWIRRSIYQAAAVKPLALGDKAWASSCES